MGNLIVAKFLKKQKEIFLKKFIFGNKEKEKLYREHGVINILSPGRINIIGEHTDYNLGLSLPMAIDKYKFFTAMRNYSSVIEIYDIGLDQQYNFAINKIIYDKKVKWSNYIKGILEEYISRDYKVSGFSLVINSNLASGVGISSSAAILAGLAKTIEGLFNLNVDLENTMLFCKLAENNFVGIENGFLDHYAVLYGKKDNALFLDFKNNSYEYIPINFENFLFLIIDSKEKRYLPTTDYNKRRKECEDALKLIIELLKNKTIKSLSDIKLEMLESLKGKLPKKLYKRTRHVITENNRVRQTGEYLKKGNIEALGKILVDSHKSLKEDYKVSTEKLDFLVEKTIDIKGVYGSRLMGAGFGGSVLSIINKNNSSEIIETISSQYYKKYDIFPNFIICKSSDGTKRVLN